MTLQILSKERPSLWGRSVAWKFHILVALALWGTVQAECQGLHFSGGTLPPCVWREGALITETQGAPGSGRRPCWTLGNDLDLNHRKGTVTCTRLEGWKERLMAAKAKGQQAENTSRDAEYSSQNREQFPGPLSAFKRLP